jgi:hypothetical protein
VHILDLATKKERFFTDGSGLEIVPNGDYKGCLLIQKHNTSSVAAPTIGSGWSSRTARKSAQSAKPPTTFTAPL